MIIKTKQTTALQNQTPALIHGLGSGGAKNINRIEFSRLWPMTDFISNTAKTPAAKNVTGKKM